MKPMPPAATSGGCGLFGLSVSGAERYTATVDHPALAGLTSPAD